MSTIACDIPRSALDEPAWRALCETAADKPPEGCGLSHDIYVERFQFGDRRATRSIAGRTARSGAEDRTGMDYATPAERQETQDWNAEHGYCSHGIEFGYCPAGCDREMTTGTKGKA